MKISTKPKFDNVLLKRWLLKVGPVRRKILLTKFRADLVRLGLSKLAWREGLLQLSSRPFVSLIREATTQKTRNDHVKGPKSKIKDTQMLRENNNDNNKDVRNQGSGRVSSSSCNREHSKTERRESWKVDFIEQPECSTSGVAKAQQRATNISKKLVKTGESDRRCSGESRKNKLYGQLRGKRKHWVPTEGDNPNGIVWCLINFDTENPLKSSGVRQLLHLRQADRQKKKDRLRAKFLKIFGEDIDPPESDSSFLNGKTHETLRGTIPEATITSGEIIEFQEMTETLIRRSPTFSNRGRKRRKENNAVSSAMKLKTTNVCTEKESIPTDHATNVRGEDSRYFQEEINTMQDTLVINPVASTCQLLWDQMTVNIQNATVEKSNTDCLNAISIITDSAATDRGTDSNFANSDKTVERTGIETLDSGLTSESDHEPPVTTDASPSSVETMLVTRQQSVIVKFDKKLGEPIQVISVESESIPQLKSVLNKEADLKQEAEIENSSASDVGTSTSEAAVDNPRMKTQNLPETTTSSCNRILKTEPKDQFNTVATPPRPFEQTPFPLSDKQLLNIGANSCSFDAFDNDSNPSSTTDMESSCMLVSGVTCVSDRLLGALDNIYLALHCRRRIREREQTASKLAIKRNRQEEVLKAKHEFESKLIIFRDEICYLFNRLDTWDRVLRFIAQGLDHRTPAGIKPFSAAEVELAMLEAEIKVPFCTNKNEPTVVPKLQSAGRVLCTIDLTVDNREDAVMIDHCDSSTDPPRFQTQLTIHRKFEPAIDEDDGSRNHDLNANEIHQHSPSISEVKTISPQQFERIGDKFESSLNGEDDPCYLCSRTSLVACSLCAKATYCSKDCQEAHWEQSHYATCVPLKEVISCQQ